MMLISHMQHFSRCLNRMNFDQLPSSSKPSTVPMVSHKCTRSPMDVRRSITPRSCGKTTGNLGKFIQILRISWGQPGLPGCHCHHAIDIKGVLGLSNHLTTQQTVSTERLMCLRAKGSQDFHRPSDQPRVLRCCHNMSQLDFTLWRRCTNFERLWTSRNYPLLMSRNLSMATSTKPTQTPSHQLMQRRAAPGPSASELVRLHHHRVICQDASRKMHIFNRRLVAYLGSIVSFKYHTWI